MKDLNHLELNDQHFIYPYGRNRGFRIGYFTYNRKDKLSLTDEDLLLIKNQNLGQTNRVIRHPDGLTCLYKFEDDST